MTGPKNRFEPDLDQARAFLELLDPEAGAFTFQTFDDTPAKSRSLAKVWHGSLEDLAEPLTTLQQAGAGVFVTINETDAQRPPHGGEHRCRARLLRRPRRRPARAGHGVRASSRTSRSRVSPGRFHAYWRVHDLPLEQFRRSRRRSPRRFNGDKSVNDLPRVMRLPGFWHQKAEPFMTQRSMAAPPGEPYSAEQMLAEFPPIAATTRHAPPASGDYEELAELVRQVMTAENFHEPLVRLAWRFIKDGMPAGKVIETLQGLLLAVPEPHDERWQARFDEIERTVASAEAKQFRAGARHHPRLVSGTTSPGIAIPTRASTASPSASTFRSARSTPTARCSTPCASPSRRRATRGASKRASCPPCSERHKDGAYGELLKNLPPARR